MRVTSTEMCGHQRLATYGSMPTPNIRGSLTQKSLIKIEGYPAVQ